MTGIVSLSGRRVALGAKYDSSCVKRLTGATDRQLRYWSHIRFVVPSIQDSEGRQGRPRIYSGSDVVRIYAIVRLLECVSLQKIRSVA
jgi:DNA-binding transcriptional MerR regulator